MTWAMLADLLVRITKHVKGTGETAENTLADWLREHSLRPEDLQTAYLVLLDLNNVVHDPKVMAEQNVFRWR